MFQAKPISHRGAMMQHVHFRARVVMGAENFSAFLTKLSAGHACLHCTDADTAAALHGRAHKPLILAVRFQCQTLLIRGHIQRVETDSFIVTLDQTEENRRCSAKMLLGSRAKPVFQAPSQYDGGLDYAPPAMQNRSRDSFAGPALKNRSSTRHYYPLSLMGF